MASVFCYYHPRGIKEVYKVGILIDLARTERLRIFREASLQLSWPIPPEGFQPKGEELKPTKTEEVKGRKQYYFIITRFKPPEVITIEITDVDVPNKKQLHEYRASYDTIDFYSTKSNTTFNKISVYDLDSKVKSLFGSQTVEVPIIRKFLDEN